MLPILVAVGIGALIAGCDDSEVSQQPKDASISDAAPPDGKTPKDADIADAGAPPDTYSPPDGPPPQILSPDVNIAPSTKLAIFAGQFGSPEGLLARMNLNPIENPVVEANIASTDVILRYQEGKLYAIDRTNATLYAFDNNLEWVEIFVYGDSGSNPQDIVVLPGDKAYVTLLDPKNGVSNNDDILIVTSPPDVISGSIDLTPYTTDDGDRLARAAQMVLVGAELYVVLQDLSSSFAADTNGKVVVINTATDEVTDVVQLDGRNPADITYSKALDKVFVTNTGVYEPDYTINTATPYGGVETINPNTHLSEGIFVDDADLGGPVSEIRLASASEGFVITNFVTLASFNPETGAVISTNVYTTPHYFLPDFSIDALGRLVIADQAVGMVIGNAAPITLAQPPSSITFLPE